VRLTKIDVAEAHLVTAVRSHFRGEHPASVYLLAASAREILTTIGSKIGVRTLLHGASQDTGKKMGRLVEAAHEHANFFKHADKDPAGVLESFSDSEGDIVLFIGCHDFLRVAKGQPIELQVFEAWWFATAHAKVELSPKFGDVWNRKGGISWGCLTPPLLHRRSDMPCPTITSPG
jgi:hypothetical protein